MKEFKKLALAAAVATLPVSGFAMEALDDATLSGVTGQDGITITIDSVAFDAIRVDDSDAFTGSSATDGAIFVKNFSMSGATTIEVDADEDTLQAAITLEAGTMNLGSIAVGEYQSSTIPATDVITLGQMDHGDITLNVQLGTEDQGSMIALTGTVNGGLSLTGFAIADGSSAETISMDLAVVSAGSTDLNLSGTIDVEAAGLVISGLGAMDVTLGSLTLGSAAAIGDISIMNLQVGDITIAGH